MATRPTSMSIATSIPGACHRRLSPLCLRPLQERRAGPTAVALEEAFVTAGSGYSEAVTEFHIVGGLHPDLPFQYFLDLCAGLKQRFPQVHLKAFTMVEVAYLSKRAKLSVRNSRTIESFRRGLASRRSAGKSYRRFATSLIAPNRWRPVARLPRQTRPQVGLKSNTTMLYRRPRKRREPASRYER